MGWLDGSHRSRLQEWRLLNHHSNKKHNIRSIGPLPCFYGCCNVKPRYAGTITVLTQGLPALQLKRLEASDREKAESRPVELFGPLGQEKDTDGFRDTGVQALNNILQFLLHAGGLEQILLPETSPV